MSWAIALLLALQDDRIEGLIKDLDSDEPSKRDQATAELVRIGKPALPALRKAAKDSDSAEIKSRAELAIDGTVDAEIKKMLRERLPKVHLTTKPLNCRDEVDRFFPGYRFYLITQGEERATRAAFLTPENEILDYELSLNHKDEETLLLKHVKKAGVTIKSKDDAKKFGLLWLLLAYGSEEFKVETTDHQNEVRY